MIELDHQHFRCPPTTSIVVKTGCWQVFVRSRSLCKSDGHPFVQRVDKLLAWLGGSLMICATASADGITYSTPATISTNFGQTASIQGPAAASGYLPYGASPGGGINYNCDMQSTAMLLAVEGQTPLGWSCGCTGWPSGNVVLIFDLAGYFDFTLTAWSAYQGASGVGTPSAAILYSGGDWSGPPLVSLSASIYSESHSASILLAPGRYSVRLAGHAVGPCGQGSGAFLCNKSGANMSGHPTTAIDVDADGVPDLLDNCPTLANADQADCNADGIGDVCEVQIIARETANLGAFSYSAPAQGTLVNCPRTTTPVSLRVDAIADLGSATTEFASLTLGGVMISQYMFLATGSDCPTTPDAETVTVSAQAWNAIVDAASGNIPVRLIGSALVDGAQCASPYSRVSVRYGGPDYDCNLNGIADLCEIASGEADCDGDGRLDACELAAGSENDVDGNGVPDVCQGDCNANGLPDSYELANGLALDCNQNDIPDSCDIASGASLDCNGNAVPDSCDILSGAAQDCNANAVPDSCDILSGVAQDCNSNAVPDSCDIGSGVSNDVEPNGVPDECKSDCNGNRLPDAWEILTGLELDCNANTTPDSCEIASGASRDCNGNTVPDSCDIAGGAADKDQDGRPDSCEEALGDWDLNGLVDGVELSIILGMWGSANPPVGDCNGDGTVDGADLAILLGRWGPVPD